MKLVTIEELKENDVVLVNRPVPEEGGITHRFYLGRVVTPCNPHNKNVRVVIQGSWFIECRKGAADKESCNSRLMFDANEPGAAAQLVGQWNPETRKVEPV